MMICPFMYGQNHWNTDIHAYDLNMSITAVICLDGVEQRSSELEIAAFCNDELRGNKRAEYEEKLDRYIVYLTVYGNENFDINFKIYDHDLEEEINCTSLTSLEYISYATIGEILNPFVINFEMPFVTFIGNGSWNIESNWENSILPTDDDNVLIDGNASITEGNNITVRSLKINENKSLTIENTAKLTVKANIDNTDVDALILKDGAQIVHDNTDVAATFMKDISNPSSWINHESGWQFIASPMSNSLISNFATSYENGEGDYDLYKYDGTQEYQWVNYKIHDDFEETFIPGRAYLASYENQTMALFQGNLNEKKSFDFSIDNNPDNHWSNFYLLGNPFSFDIDWNDMNHNMVENGFATLNATTGTYVYKVDESIKVGEGFMIYTRGENPTLSYEISSKSTKESINYVNIIVSNDKGSDNLILVVNENESKGFPKLDNFNDNIANIYVNDNDTNYGIFNCSELNEVAVSFDTKEMGSYNLRFDINGRFDDIYLFDKITKENVNISLEKEYNFISTSHDIKDRFVITMTNNDENDIENFAFFNNDVLIIKDLIDNTEINIYDVSGRCVYHSDHAKDYLTTYMLKAGVYLVQKIDNKGIKTQKIIID